MSLNPYHVLELKTTASDDEIRAAYKRMAFRHHPDRNRGSALHTERFKEIVEAYDILSDPDKRARFDRRFGTVNRPQQHTATPPPPSNGRPSPYGNPYTYNPFTRTDDVKSGPRPSGTGKRFTSPSSHHIFIALTILGCIMMASLWLGSVMNRQTAKKALMEGDFMAALTFDSTYADAWFAKGKNLIRTGYVQIGLRDMDKALALTDEKRPDWYWQRGLILQQFGAYGEAKSSYQAAWTSNVGAETHQVRVDSLRVRLSGLSLFVFNEPDSAYALLKADRDIVKGNGRLSYMLGLAALRSGHLSESIPLLQTAADGNYERREAYFHLGNAYFSTADTSRACVAWDISLTNGKEEALPLMKRFCTFEAHTPITENAFIDVQPGSSN